MMYKFLLYIGIVVGMSLVPHVQAGVTTPQKMVYNGHLLTPAGVPITTSHTIRFSIWNSSDFVATDVSAGNINTGAPAYLGWQEEHTITPDSNGYFTLELGSITPLFSVINLATSDIQDMYLQIEVKASVSPTTAYESLDIDATDSTRDRTPMLSVPFALNADYLDQREVGTGSGDIALLAEGGVFSPQTIPDGTFKDAFIIDFDDTATGAITLQFGNVLAKKLIYDTVNDYFEFNDDVRIDGDLYVTGLINGVDITSLASSSASQLQVLASTGLTIGVTQGNYRLAGTTVEYAGATSIAVVDNTTNYAYFDASGLQVNTTGFPANQSIIRLATIVTAGGAVTLVDDARVFASDDRSTTEVVRLEPMYPQVNFASIGPNDVGALKLQYNIAQNRDYYAWRSTRATLQEYAIIVSVPLPANFTGFDATALELDYLTDSASSADTSVRIEVLDSTNTTVALVGASTGLTSTTWATTSLGFTGGTFTPGQSMTIKIVTSSRNDLDAAIGALVLRYFAL
jgi:hypothetical protein